MDKNMVQEAQQQWDKTYRKKRKDLIFAYIICEVIAIILLLIWWNRITAILPWIPLIIYVYGRIKLEITKPDLKTFENDYSFDSHGNEDSVNRV